MDVRTKQQTAYDIARLAWLAMAALTAANIGIGLISGEFTFVATAAVPEIVSLVGLWSYAASWPLYITILCGVAVVLCLAVYVLCWALSKKRIGWLTAAVVLYAIDYVFRLYLLVCDLMDCANWLMLAVRILIPTAILVLLIRGRVAVKK